MWYFTIVKLWFLIIADLHLFLAVWKQAKPRSEKRSNLIYSITLCNHRVSFNHIKTSSFCIFSAYNLCNLKLNLIGGHKGSLHCIRVRLRARLIPVILSSVWGGASRTNQHPYNAHLPSHLESFNSMPKTSLHHTQTLLLPLARLRSQPAYQMSFKCSCYLWLGINSLYKSLADVFVTAILFHIHRLVYVYVCALEREGLVWIIHTAGVTVYH